MPVSSKNTNFLQFSFIGNFEENRNLRRLEMF